jgi:hypothetical protein
LRLKITFFIRAVPASFVIRENGYPSLNYLLVVQDKKYKYTAIRLNTDFVCFVGPGEDQVFVTIPRFKPGVPATLNTVIISEEGKPLLSPYPDWGWHREGDCDDMTSVFRVQVCQLRNKLTMDIIMLIFSVGKQFYIHD